MAARVRSLATIDERFVVAAGGSSRFGDALLRDYVDVRDDERVMQFSAVTADLDNGETYVAFRGTDTTLVGWRENFVLSFAVTQAQRAAADYLARELERAAARGLPRARGRTLEGREPRRLRRRERARPSFRRDRARLQQ